MADFKFYNRNTSSQQEIIDRKSSGISPPLQNYWAEPQLEGTYLRSPGRDGPKAQVTPAG